MPSDQNKAAEVAFRQLRLSLGDIVDQFRTWTEIPEGSPASIRMRKLIADHVALAVDYYLTDMIFFIGMADAKSLQSVEKILASSVSNMNLPERIRLQDYDEIIRWVQDELSMMLDLGQYIHHPERPNDIYQHIHRTNESAINLRFAYNRELQQETLDSEFSVVRDELQKVTRGGLDLQSSIQKVRDLTLNLEDLRAESAAKSEQLDKFRLIAEQAAKRAEQAEQNFSSVQAQQEILNEEDSKTALISHFETFHSSHETKSTRYFVIGISVLSVVATFAVVYAFLLADEPVSWPALAWKLAVVAGGSAIGTYLLRQSNYHRSLSVWSNTVSVQLQTFTPYIQLIGEESSRDQLRMEFARRVFGNEPGSMEKHTEPTSNTTAIADLSTLVSNVSKLQGGTTPKGSS